MTHPNTDSRELEEILKIPLLGGDIQELADAILAYTANKQKALLDSLHREIFSDAGVMDITEIAKLIRDKKESL